MLSVATSRRLLLVDLVFPDVSLQGTPDHIVEAFAASLSHCEGRTPKRVRYPDRVTAGSSTWHAGEFHSEAHSLDLQGWRATLL